MSKRVFVHLFGSYAAASMVVGVLRSTRRNAVLPAELVLAWTRVWIAAHSMKRARRY